MSVNTFFLRLEGPLQAWGGQESKFVIRRTAEAPTKSGVLGILCAALGVPRRDAANEWLSKLCTLRMGVRIDRPGRRWWDYHTVGAGMWMRIAEGEGKTKPGAMLTRREYLCDASFLVALQGDPSLVEALVDKMRNPQWMVYLGRKCCPPGSPILMMRRVENRDAGTGIREPLIELHADLRAALTSKSVPWRRRSAEDPQPETVACLLDWEPSPECPEAPEDAVIWYDVPVAFDPPAHRARFLLRCMLAVGPDGEVTAVSDPEQRSTPSPSRPRADYGDTAYRKVRQARLDYDHRLCVFCKAPATTVQHVTYRHAGGDERLEELRSLCRLCHDAVTMIEYGLGMGLDRINPEDLQWREKIIEKRKEIIEFRSIETRRRRLAAEEVE